MLPPMPTSPPYWLIQYGCNGEVGLTYKLSNLEMSSMLSGAPNDSVWGLYIVDYSDVLLQHNNGLELEKYQTISETIFVKEIIF